MITRITRVSVTVSRLIMIIRVIEAHIRLLASVGYYDYEGY